MEEFRGVPHLGCAVSVQKGVPREVVGAGGRRIGVIEEGEVEYVEAARGEATGFLKEVKVHDWLFI